MGKTKLRQLSDALNSIEIPSLADLPLEKRRIPWEIEAFFEDRLRSWWSEFVRDEKRKNAFFEAIKNSELQFEPEGQNLLIAETLEIAKFLFICPGISSYQRLHALVQDKFPVEPFIYKLTFSSPMAESLRESVRKWTEKAEEFGADPQKTQKPVEDFVPGFDYRMVRWHGQEFIFSPRQAHIVEILHKAHQNGTPLVGQAALLAGVESGAKRLLDLFRDHPAWGTFIESDGQGLYRLNI